MANTHQPNGYNIHPRVYLFVRKDHLLGRTGVQTTTILTSECPCVCQELLAYENQREHSGLE